MLHRLSVIKRDTAKGLYYFFNICLFFGFDAVRQIKLAIPSAFERPKYTISYPIGRGPAINFAEKVELSSKNQTLVKKSDSLTVTSNVKNIEISRKVFLTIRFVLFMIVVKRLH